MQSDTLEEQYAIKFCFKLGKNATETYGMFQTAFGASCMNRASVFEWHKSGNLSNDLCVCVCVYIYIYIYIYIWGFTEKF